MSERVDERTAFSRTWDMGSGRRVTQTTAVPAQWRDGDGDWHPFDTTVRDSEDGWEGVIGKARVELPSRLAGGSTGAISVRNGSGDAIHLNFRGLSGEGHASGDTVTYPDALDGVDVRL